MTREEFLGWRGQAATVEIFKEIGKLKDILKDDLTSGNTLCETADETLTRTAKAVGTILGLSQLEEYDVPEDKKDEE